MKLYYKGVLCNLATYRVMGEDKPALYYVYSSDQETMLKAGFVDVQPCLWVKLLTDDEYNEIINKCITENSFENMKPEEYMKKKILIVLTNTEKYKNNDIPTGLWLGELIHFYEEIKSHGYEADFISPKGGYVPIDPYSMKFMNNIDYKWYGNNEFINRALSNTQKPSDIKAEDYFAIYYTGGHGVLWDFPENVEIQNIAMSIYNSGGYISAVCHGSGLLLLQMKKQFEDHIIEEGFFGQEINITNFNLARMNMFLHNVNYNNFSIKRGDTLLNPLHNEEKPFDAIVSNPPYSIKWIGDGDPTLINDERFSPAGKLAPKSYVDFAFILHSLSYLSSKGRAAIVCFPGIFYRKGAEQTIRKYLVENNFVDTVIQLPDNLFWNIDSYMYFSTCKE